MAANVPLSQLIRSKEEEVLTEPLTKSREEWRKAKELEEARKAGTAPAAVDEEGRDINPHIPQYISSAPWYVGAAGPTLKHQREPDEHKKTFDPLSLRYLRGAERLVSKQVTKYRKGACENCGALTHNKKDCLERPRKIGAKYSNTDIAPDELPQPDINFSFDGKRDRWNGYDPNDYLAVVDEFQKVEEAKRVLKAEKLSTGTGGIDLPDGMVLDEEVIDGEDDEDKYVDDVDMPGTKVDSKQRITVRNLRIREDVAKYLRNLDPNSAYYDPKTRAMRDNPYKDTGKSAEEVDYAGENFVRFSGDTRQHALSQLFAWEASERGVDVHVLAEPTKLQLLQRAFETKKQEFKGSLSSSVLSKYGGEEHLQVPPRELLLAQTEDYAEYSRQGKILKGHEKQIIRSKYEEDVYPNNHSSIYGSYWRDGNWGYHCCHSLIKNSYCTGLTGRSVNDNVPLLETLQSKADEEEGSSSSFLPPKTKKDELLTSANNPSSTSSTTTQKTEDSSPSVNNLNNPISLNTTITTTTKLSKNQKRREKEKRRKMSKKESKRQKMTKNKKKESSSSSSSSSSSDSSDSSSSDDEEIIRKKELKKALKLEKIRAKEAEEIVDDRKRKYNSRYEEKKLTDAELEAFQMMREREDDPMLQFMNRNKK